MPHNFPMRFPPWFLALLVLSSAALRAQQDLSPPNLEALAKELDLIEQKQRDSKQSGKAALLARLRAALANGQTASAFYVDAVEAVDFKGKKDSVEAFQNWRKSRADMLRSREMQTALLLHLRYLLLSLERQGLENPATQVPAVLTYVNDLVAADAIFENQKSPPDEQKNLLARSLTDSVFSRWLGFGDWLPGAEDWERTPGNVAGILDKNVRTILRKEKSPQLVQTWDLQMKVEADRVTEGRSEHQAEQFNTVARPRLLFSRAQDMILVGQPNRGLNEMIQIVRTYPVHPDFDKWIAAIRKVIKPPSEDTSPQ